MSESSLTIESRNAAADRQNLDVRLPSFDQLFIDIDDEWAHTKFLRNIEILKQEFPFLDWESTPSKSGLPHRHIVVTLHEPIETQEQRLMLQAFLGSDPTHELLSWIAGRHGNTQPTVFFEVRP